MIHDGPPSSVTSYMEDGEQDEIDALDLAYPHVDCLLPVQTVSDFSDAVRLLMIGHHVSTLPIAGVLSAMVRPCRIKTLLGFPRQTGVTVTRRVRADVQGETVRPRKRGWHIVVIDTPASIANAVAEILACSDWRLELTIDLSRIDAERGSVLGEAFAGFCGVLNHRAHRILTVCDIADCLEWFVSAAPDSARLDCAIPYGHPSWGFFLRRGTDIPELADHRPDPSLRASRSVHCMVRPDRADLDKMLVYAATARHVVGVVNMARVDREMTGGRGLSCDGAAVLPAYGWRPRVRLNLGSVVAGEARWRACAVAGRHMLRSDRRPPSGLQSTWRDVHGFRRTFSVEIVGASDDDRRHVGYAVAKLADIVRTAQPDAQRPHGQIVVEVGEIVRLDPMRAPGLADDLAGRWGDVLGVRITGR